jgi:hypothetical protein
MGLLAKHSIPYKWRSLWQNSSVNFQFYSTGCVQMDQKFHALLKRGAIVLADPLTDKYPALKGDRFNNRLRSVV